MMLEVCWDGLYTLSFGLSQFHGHGSWLACEVALRPQGTCKCNEKFLSHVCTLERRVDFKKFHAIVEIIDNQNHLERVLQV